MAPRLTLGQLDPVVQTRPDCPVLETGRSLPRASLGFTFPRALSKNLVFTKSQAHDFFLSGQEEKEAHNVSRPCDFCPFLPAQHKADGQRICKGGVLGVRAYTGCLNSENIILTFSLQTKSLGLLHIVLFSPQIIHKSHV